MNERFHKWGEWQLRSTTDFELEFATILAVGGRCFFADQPYPDGTLEPAVYEELRQAHEFEARASNLFLERRWCPMWRYLPVPRLNSSGRWAAAAILDASSMARSASITARAGPIASTAPIWR